MPRNPADFSPGTLSFPSHHPSLPRTPKLSDVFPPERPSNPCPNSAGRTDAPPSAPQWPRGTPRRHNRRGSAWRMCRAAEGWARHRPSYLWTPLCRPRNWPRGWGPARAGPRPRGYSCGGNRWRGVEGVEWRGHWRCPFPVGSVVDGRGSNWRREGTRWSCGSDRCRAWRWRRGKGRRSRA